MKYKKSLIIILSCFIVVGITSFVWRNISNNEVFVDSKDGKWRVEYVKADESFDPKNKYYCILTYQGEKPQNIESLSFKYYYEGSTNPASSGDYTKDEIKLPLNFGYYGAKLKSGEERIVKLEWKESGKTYKENLIIKQID